MFFIPQINGLETEQLKVNLKAHNETCHICEEIVDVIIKHHVSGIILTNTTNSNRNNLKSSAKNEEGGLSGEPLQQISTKIFKKFYKQLNGKIPIYKKHI